MIAYMFMGQEMQAPRNAKLQSSPRFQGFEAAFLERARSIGGDLRVILINGQSKGIEPLV
jgi:hypothetical protein